MCAYVHVCTCVWTGHNHKAIQKPYLGGRNHLHVAFDPYSRLGYSPVMLHVYIFFNVNFITAVFIHALCRLELCMYQRKPRCIFSQPAHSRMNLVCVQVYILCMSSCMNLFLYFHFVRVLQASPLLSSHGCFLGSTSREVSSTMYKHTYAHACTCMYVGV